MPSSAATLLAVSFAMLLSVPGVATAESASASVTVTATFAPRTSLSVSSRLLDFDIAGSGQPATATVEFSAKARAGIGAEIVLAVEPLHAVDSSITFRGEGEGTLDGVLATASPAVAGRWTGSGVRQGRLVFSLRADAPGAYTLPVRFILTAP